MYIYIYIYIYICLPSDGFLQIARSGLLAEKTSATVT